MSTAFITLWAKPQLEIERRAQPFDRRLNHTANRQFRARGVVRGDRVYVVAVRNGQLLLIGRLIVQHLVDQREAERRLRRADVYEAPDHLLGQGSILDLDRVIPDRTARLIERASGKRLKIAPDEYRVDANCLRTTGEITHESASLLDELLS